MKNQAAGAAALACALMAGGVLPGAPRAQAQGPQAPPAPRAEPRDKGEEEKDESILGQKLGSVCTIRHQAGSSVARDTGVLRQVDDDWLVLDELKFVRSQVVAQDGGRKVTRSLWQRTGKQLYVSTEFALTLEFGADASVL